MGNLFFTNEQKTVNSCYHIGVRKQSVQMYRFPEVKQELLLSIRYSTKVLKASGDEINLNIIQLLMESGSAGLRVPEITKKTYLSRPSVSHHLRILVDAGIVGVQRIGTMNYYYVDIKASAIDSLSTLVNSMISYHTNFPEMIDGKFDDL